jgi:CSLREA domain-containing protein
MTRRITMFAALAMALALPASAGAATFTVDTTNDTNSASGCTTGNPCSLREAIAAVNSSPDSSNTINLPAGNYDLSLGELNIDPTATDPVTTISGAGARTTTVRAAADSRVLDAVRGDITVEGVTLTGGSAPVTGSTSSDFPGDGGAILTRADTLTLNRVTVSNSTAGLNGGGIAVPPESSNSTQGLVINASTIAGNKVAGGAVEGLGGGVYVLGDLSITNSTITGNSVENAVGTSQGGGVLAALQPTQTTDTEIKLLNATIAGNSVPAATGMGGGLASYIPPATMATAGLTVTNTIVSGNTAGTTPNDCMLATVPTTDHDLSGDTSCQFSDPGSLTGTNPQLGAPADNGGPTDTLALAAGSPAIDAGTNTGCPAVDQRGTPRPQGTACDIGAFERVPDPPPPESKSADLSVSLKAKPKRPKPRGKLRYTVVVRNGGPDAATDVTLTGKVSKKVKRLKPGSPCELGAGKKGKRSFTCDLGQIADGGTATVKLRAKLAKRARAGKASVRVSSQTPDPSGGNDAAKLKSKVKRKR